ncbi:MAG: arginine--tRNA ligase [Leptospiraceae bacterium]|nr:arginine--tRNA ligase [Leptospiraceae bacterium]
MLKDETIRDWLSLRLKRSLDILCQKEGVRLSNYSIRIDYPPNFSLGQYASPLAMQLSRFFDKKPQELAHGLVQTLRDDDELMPYVEKIELAPPAFINFTLKSNIASAIFPHHSNGLEEYLKRLMRPRGKIIVEFVSANPTGPLNIVSARAAAFGDSLCRILAVAGYQVYREYYVNDYGNQVYWLGISLAYRYAEALGLGLPLPENAYQGEYLKDIVKKISAELKLPEFPKEEKAFFEWACEHAMAFALPAMQYIVANQRQDLKDFRVEFDNFFYESSLHPQAVNETFQFLKANGQVYEKDGAWFLLSSEKGDDKDRVVIRSDGRPTYFLADIAYHRKKIERGFDKILNLWGPDHHGYIARMRSALSALGFLQDNPERFSVLIVQQVNLIEGGKTVVMSKRLGKFQTMRDLLNRIPVDVCRYFFVMRGASNHLDFDLELATTQSERNPVYYIQYAHARIHSIFRQAGLNFDEFPIDFRGKESYLEGHFRKELLFYVLRLAEEIQDIARNYELQSLAVWLYETAHYFSQFYSLKQENNVLRLYREKPQEGEALLSLIKLVALALEKGLFLLGISAPRAMHREDEIP